MDALRYPTLTNLDLRLARNTKIGSVTITPSIELFNALNNGVVLGVFRQATSASFDRVDGIVSADRPHRRPDQLLRAPRRSPSERRDRQSRSLSRRISSQTPKEPSPADDNDTMNITSTPCLTPKVNLRTTLLSVERTLIHSVLIASDWNQRKAASALGLQPTTLSQKMQRLELGYRPVGRSPRARSGAVARAASPHASGPRCVVTPARTILYGGLAVGVPDIVKPILFAMFRGASPVRLLQGIAQPARSAGKRFREGTRRRFWALVSTSSSRSPSSPPTTLRAVICGRSSPTRWPSGPPTGSLLYFFMQFVVFPLSAIGPVKHPPGVLIDGILTHIFCVGLPTGFVIREAARRRADSISELTQ